MGTNPLDVLNQQNTRTGGHATYGVRSQTRRGPMGRFRRRAPAFAAAALQHRAEAAPSPARQLDALADREPLPRPAVHGRGLVREGVQRPGPVGFSARRPSARGSRPARSARAAPGRAPASPAGPPPPRACRRRSPRPARSADRGRLAASAAGCPAWPAPPPCAASCAGSGSTTRSSGRTARSGRSAAGRGRSPRRRRRRQAETTWHVEREREREREYMSGWRAADVTRPSRPIAPGASSRFVRLGSAAWNRVGFARA